MLDQVPASRLYPSEGYIAHNCQLAIPVAAASSMRRLAECRYNDELRASARMQVASFHEAEKQRSGMFSAKGPGRLIVFNNDSISFFWTEGEMEPIIASFVRIDVDIE